MFAFSVCFQLYVFYWVWYQQYCIWTHQQIIKNKLNMFLLMFYWNVRQHVFITSVLQVKQRLVSDFKLQAVWIWFLIEASKWNAALSGANQPVNEVAWITAWPREMSPPYSSGRQPIKRFRHQEETNIDLLSRVSSFVVDTKYSACSRTQTQKVLIIWLSSFRLYSFMAETRVC